MSTSNYLSLLDIDAARGTGRIPSDYPKLARAASVPSHMSNETAHVRKLHLQDQFQENEALHIMEWEEALQKWETVLVLYGSRISY